MKTQLIYTLGVDTDSVCETEVFASKKELYTRLREIMMDAYAETEENANEWARRCRARWKKRLADPKNTWQAWKQFRREEGPESLKGYEDNYSIGEHDIELPAEIQKALQSADSSLTNYHRHLWASDRKTHGGLEREAVVKTVKAIRKILGTNTPGQSL